MKKINIEMPEEESGLLVSSGEASAPSTIPHEYPIPHDSPIPALCPLYKTEVYLAKGMRWSIVIFATALACFMALQVFMRYVFKNPLLSIEELAPLFALWLYFLGLAHATRQRNHISGGIIMLIVQNPKVIRWIRFCMTTICFLTILVFVYYAQKYALFNLGINRKSPYLQLSTAFWQFSMVAGFWISAFYLLLQMISEFRACLFPKNTLEALK